MSDLPGDHDPLRTLSDLRDHLARHDKPIAFFFGAGTSCAVRVPNPKNHQETMPIVPAVDRLTEICRDTVAQLGSRFEDSWKSIETSCTTIGRRPHIENMLSQIRMMLAAVNETDTLSGLKKEDIGRLEKTVRKTIANHVAPDLTSLPSDYPHRKFARWLLKSSRVAPVEIFTVNYDVLIEHAMELERLPLFDGFVGGYQPFFFPESLRRPEAAPGTSWTRLWKLHGSVTWRRIEQDGHLRIIRDTPNPDGEMIYPSFLKYDESRQQPYSAFFDRLSRFLDQDDVLLIIAGWSFGDDHINNLIFGALENRPRSHVYALLFENLPEDSELARRAHHRPNMIVIGPDAGVIGGRRAPWARSEVPSSMKGAFELEGDAPGPMKIGEFEALCDFLGLMTAG